MGICQEGEELGKDRGGVRPRGRKKRSLFAKTPDSGRRRK